MPFLFYVFEITNVIRFWEIYPFMVVISKGESSLIYRVETESLNGVWIRMFSVCLRNRFMTSLNSLVKII